MKTEKPTPIPKRASRPQPITLSTQPTLDERINTALKKALYKLAHTEEEAYIVKMSYEEFEAFWARVMEEE